MLLQVLRRGIARGEFRSINPDAVVDTLVAPMMLTMTWRCSFGRVLTESQHRSLPPLDYLELSLDLMLNGLKTSD
jgi:hypothetical protein